MFMSCLSFLSTLWHGFLALPLPGTSISLAAIIAGLVFFPVMVRTVVKLFSALEGPDVHSHSYRHTNKNNNGDD